MALSEIIGSNCIAEAVQVPDGEGVATPVADSAAKPAAVKSGYLDQIRLINVRSEKEVTCRLLEELDAYGERKPLTELHLSGMDLNHQDIVYYLVSILQYNRKLRDFTLSSCQLQGSFLVEILEALAGEYEERSGDPQLHSLNVSYNRLGPEAAGHAERVVEHICTILAKSASLTHLDLSGLCLGGKVKPVIEAVTGSEHQILIGLHLHDNSFDLETQDWILKKMGVEAQNYHRLQDRANLVDQDQREMSILQKAFQGQQKILSRVHKFFK